jgi:hypothetical protein
MRSIVLFLLTAVSIAFCQSYYETQMSVRNTFYGGIALNVGKGSSAMNPGVTACMEPVKKINKYFGAGGHIDYTWLSVANLPDNIGTGLHLFDVAFVPKAFVPVAEEMCFSFEADPGLYGTYFYYSEGGFHDSIFKLFFGFTSGAAFNIGSYSFMFKFKTIFADDRFELASLVNWIGFCAGIAL